MLFGNTHSVVCWVRMSLLALAMIRNLGGLPASVFIDDFHTFVPKGLGEKAATFITSVFDAVGLPWKSHKRKWGSNICLLGLDFLLKGRPSACISVERVEKVMEFTRGIVDRGRLSSKEASQLYGRVCFCFTSVSDRRLLPFLKSVLGRVYGGPETRLTFALRDALGAILRILPALPPRVLRNPSPSYVLWTDAAFSKGRGVMAGVLRSVLGGGMRYWRRKVYRDELDDSVKSYPINFLEAVAACVSLLVWRGILSGRRFDIRIDNTAAEIVLLNQYSNKRHMGAVTECFWTEATCNSMMPWLRRVESAKNIGDLPTREGKFVKFLSMHPSAAGEELEAGKEDLIQKVLKCSILE